MQGISWAPFISVQSSIKTRTNWRWCSWTLCKRRSNLWASNHPAVGLECFEEHALLRIAVEVEIVSSVRLERFGPGLAGTDAGHPTNRWLVLFCKYFNNKISTLGSHNLSLRPAS